MDSETIKKMYEKHKALVDSYFENDSKKLNTMIDMILFRLNFITKYNIYIAYD